MDILKNKRYNQFDYISRYSNVPYYFNSLDNRDIYGIGKNLSKKTAYVVHKVTKTDTLDAIALKYYNNPTYWWLIAYFNDIQDAFCNLFDHYPILNIPSIASIEFKELR